MVSENVSRETFRNHPFEFFYKLLELRNFHGTESVL